MSEFPIPTKIEEFELSERLTARIAAIDQGLDIARLMPECGERNQLVIAMATVWKLAHCTLFVVAEDHPEARKA